MSHNPNNRNCDRVMYGGAPDTACTCEFDSPDDAPQPSLVMPAGATAVVTPTAGDVVLTGAKARTWVELEAATRDLAAARALLQPAQERFNRALDAHAAEMCR